VSEIKISSKHPLIKALDCVVSFLQKQQIPYMIFGGIANSIYGNPRQTFDIDIKVEVEAGRPVETFIEKVAQIGQLLPENPRQFIDQTAVLPVMVNDIRIDIVFAHLPFEIESIRRSQEQKLAGLTLRVCTIEDLIIHKAISTRLKDWDDIATLIRLHKTKLDWPYLKQHCQELAEFLQRPDLLKDILRYKNAE